MQAAASYLQRGGFIFPHAGSWRTDVVSHSDEEWQQVQEWQDGLRTAAKAEEDM